MKINLTEEELRVLDNELFVVQHKLSRLNLLDGVDRCKQTEDEIKYKKTVDGLRVKIGKHLNHGAIKRFIA